MAIRVTARQANADRDVRRALVLFESEKIAESVELVTRVLAQDPADPGALQLLAVTRERLGQGSFVSVLRRLAGLARNSAHHWINLSIAQRKTGESPISATRRAMSLEPNSSKVLRQHARSVSLNDDRLTTTLRWMRRAARLDPNDVQLWVDISSASRRALEPDSALEFAERALALEPDHTSASLVVATQRSARERRVGAFFERVCRLAPIEFAVHFAHAEALSRLDQDGAAAALALFRAIASCPDRRAGLHNLGLMWRDRGSLTQAIPWLRRAAALDAQSSAPLADLGWVLHTLGKDDESVLTLQEAIKRFPRDPRPRRVLGSVALETRRAEQANLLFSESVVLDPSVSTHYNKLAMVTLAFRESHCESARPPLQRALRIDPHSVEALTNYGILLEREGSFEEACETHRSALSNGSSLQEPRLNLAICELGLGRFEQAWENYEARWSATSIVLFGRQSLSRKLATSKPVFEIGSRGRVLLWAEQGVGDEVMFASMIPDLQRSCDELIVEVDSRLRPLFERSFSKVRCVPRFGEILDSSYDYQLPIGSLGRHLRPTLTSFATQPDGYLRADPADVEHFAKKLTTRAKPLVGVSWWSQNPESGANRSIPLGDLLAALSGYGIPVNLQYGEQQAAFVRGVTERGIEACSVDEIDNQKDLDQLAALVSACDLVISIGNTTAHLAAALGKPTWVLVPLAGSWRWMFQGATTPWYPSVRLFRRGRGESWAPVLDRVTEALREFSRSHGH
jgi:Tfp pilus assembly protein PilF